MSLFKDFQSKSLNLIELWYEAEKSGQSPAYKKRLLQCCGFTSVEKAGACREGVDFFNSLKHVIEERAHSILDAGFHIS